MQNIDEAKGYFRILMKFMDESHVDSFVHDGLLYMNTIGYFRNYENDNIRGDRYEGLEMSLLPRNIIATFGDFVLNDLIDKVDIRRDIVDEINIFCMTKLSDYDLLTAPNGRFYFSDEFKSFGNRVAVICGNDINIFNNRVNKCIQANESISAINENQIIADQVKYVDRNNYHGNMNPFMKFDNYSWQKEWRIALRQRVNSGPFELKIGCLADIAKIWNTDDVINTPVETIVT